MSYVLLAKVVNFVGVLLKYKKGKRCNTSPLKTCLKFLCEKVSRKGLWANLHCISQDLGLSVIKTPEYSSRVCTKCALKIRNAVELCRFVKDTLTRNLCQSKKTLLMKILILINIGRSVCRNLHLTRF